MRERLDPLGRRVAEPHTDALLREVAVPVLAALELGILHAVADGVGDPDEPGVDATRILAVCRDVISGSGSPSVCAMSCLVFRLGRNLRWCCGGRGSVVSGGV